MSVRAITHLAAAGLAAFLAWSYQGARLGADLAEARAAAVGEKLAVSTAQRVADARVRRAEQTINTNYQKALNAAINKQTYLQADAARAGRERDSLRKQLSDAEQRLADASPSALIQYSNTLSELLRQCSERYTALAKRADAHSVDAETCRAAWPVTGGHSANAAYVSH